MSKSIRGHSFSAYAKFSEKVTFHTPWYTHVNDELRIILHRKYQHVIGVIMLVMCISFPEVDCFRYFQTKLMNNWVINMLKNKLFVAYQSGEYMLYNEYMLRSNANDRKFYAVLFMFEIQWGFPDWNSVVSRILMRFWEKLNRFELFNLWHVFL